MLLNEVIQCHVTTNAVWARSDARAGVRTDVRGRAGVEAGRGASDANENDSNASVETNLFSRARADGSVRRDVRGQAGCVREWAGDGLARAGGRTTRGVYCGRMACLV